MSDYAQIRHYKISNPIKLAIIVRTLVQPVEGNAGSSVPEYLQMF